MQLSLLCCRMPSSQTRLGTEKRSLVEAHVFKLSEAKKRSGREIVARRKPDSHMAASSSLPSNQSPSLIIILPPRCQPTVSQQFFFPLPPLLSRVTKEIGGEKGGGACPSSSSTGIWAEEEEALPSLSHERRDPLEQRAFSFHCKTKIYYSTSLSPFPPPPPPPPFEIGESEEERERPPKRKRRCETQQPHFPPFFYFPFLFWYLQGSSMIYARLSPYFPPNYVRRRLLYLPEWRM